MKCPFCKKAFDWETVKVSKSAKRKFVLCPSCQEKIYI